MVGSVISWVVIRVYTIYIALLTFFIFISHYLLGNVSLLFPSKDKANRLALIAKGLAKFFFWFSGMRVTVKGTHNYPLDYNCVLVANHQSLLDILLLMAFIPKRLIFFAKKELRHVPILNWGLIHMGHVFVDREKASKALQQLEKMEIKLEQNLNVVVFPEGTRTVNGEVSEFKRGAFHLAAKMKKPVVPCYIKGTFNILKKDKLIVHPGKITLVIGEPIKPNVDEHIKISSKAMQQKANEMVQTFEQELSLDKL